MLSFNRGHFSRHSVHSLERHALGAKVNIVDDNSDDAETRELLSDLSLRYRAPWWGHAAFNTNMAAARIALGGSHGAAMPDAG